MVGLRYERAGDSVSCLLGVLVIDGGVIGSGGCYASRVQLVSLLECHEGGRGKYNGGT
jgi:hypothetical protein